MIRSSIRTPVLAAALIGALPAWADLETGGNEHAAADLRRPDTASLHRAARTADLGSLKAALAAGVKVDAHDERGWTALMHAANENHSPLVEELLRAGADPDVQAPDGTTPLFRAALHGYTEIIALLMEAEADVLIVGPRGRTAMDMARARYGFPDRLRRSGEHPAVAALQEGRFRDCEECPELVIVPAGSFLMGSPSDEAVGSDPNEGPLHAVTISLPFAAGKYEVTFDEWDYCVRRGGCGGYRPDDKGRGRGRFPVTNVSWEDASSYVRWLSEETGKKYRLLTESQWEYAARAGTRGPYHFGSRIAQSQASFSLRIGNPKSRGTVPVGSYPANVFGLHDVHGNVWEWVQDCWQESYEGALSNGAASGPRNCGVRVLRGGSWANLRKDLRSANRYRNPATLRHVHIGFRVLRVLASRVAAPSSALHGGARRESMGRARRQGGRPSWVSAVLRPGSRTADPGAPREAGRGGAA